MTKEQYIEYIARLHKEIGIPEDYALRSGLPLHLETEDLAASEADMFGRPQQMTPRTLQCWKKIKSQADSDGIEILLVSAYRSTEYQKSIFDKKIKSGESLENILKVNAAPGYSEHHTGRALDLATPGYPPLTEAFEETDAFQWLKENAAAFYFKMSFPRENPYGLNYEPWHWACILT